MEQFQPIFKANGITEQQWRVIRALQEMGESNAQDLAKASDVLSPSLSRIISYLESNDLIIKSVLPEDLRAYKIELSPKGNALCTEIGRSVDKVYGDIKRQFCPEKYAELYALLHELTALCKK